MKPLGDDKMLHRLTQSFKLVSSGLCVRVSVMQSVGNKQHSLHVPYGEKEVRHKINSNLKGLLHPLSSTTRFLRVQIQVSALGFV